MKTSQSAFSLIELMIVIAIIGILSAIAIPSYKTYVLKSRTADLLAYIDSGRLAVEAYVSETGDTSCNNLVNSTPNPIDPNILNTYGHWDTNVCVVASNDHTGVYDGDPFDLFYLSVGNPDGTLNWFCEYKWGACRDGSGIAPQGCGTYNC